MSERRQTRILRLAGARTGGYGDGAALEDADYERIAEAGAVLRQGGLVAFPTETVYGLGGDALEPSSSRRIYAAKGRPSDNPLIVHICETAQAEPLADRLPESFYRLADACWPGPLTMIVPKSGLVPYETTGGLDTVALRMPSHPVAAELICRAGCPIAAPSANRSGRPSPTEAEHVVRDLDGEIDLILDGGTVGIGVESTILDLTGEQPELLRPGYITRERLEQICGGIREDATMMAGGGAGAPRAPGMRYRHYAPQGRMTVVEGVAESVADYILREARQQADAGERIGILCAEETRERYAEGLPDGAVVLSAGARGDEEEAARRLYGCLRDFDEAGVTRIYAEGRSRAGFGQAVMNRLLKAAGYEVARAE